MLKSKSLVLVLVMAVLLLLLGACTKRYVHIQQLETASAINATYCVTEIRDELPSNVKADDHPDPQTLSDFKGMLEGELDKKDVVKVTANPDMAQYRIEGSVIEYKKGSGFLRFMFGALAGSAGATVNLRVVDQATGEDVYSGNYKAAVTSWAQKGSDTFKQVSKDFAKQLENQIKSISKETSVGG